MNSKYEERDLLAVISGDKSLQDVADLYGTTKQAVKKALYRYGYRVRRSIKIISPYKETIYVADKQKCAEELRVSARTISKALKGERVAILDDLNIRVEYAEDDL